MKTNKTAIQVIAGAAKTPEYSPAAVKALIFPLYRVRFVALSDNYDSDENKDGIGGFDVSFKFLINELYSRDLSRKIRSAKARQQELGEAVTKNCAYPLLEQGRLCRTIPEVPNHLKQKYASVD